MTDVKFRAWDNKGKEWLMGYDSLGGFSMFGECMLFEEWSGILNRFILQQKDRKPEDLILMQFTGLKDKNGKEVYEGDILFHKGTKSPKEHILKVVWLKYKWKFMHLDDKTGHPFSQLWNHPENFEIIGNIWEHPHLIKSV